MNRISSINGILHDLDLSFEQKFVVMLHILAQFSAAIGHRPYVPGNPNTYGNLCTVLVGDTGCGKGISHRFSQSFFEAFCEPVIAPATATTNTGSMKALLREIHSVLGEEERLNRGEVRIYHVNEEFAGELRAAGSSYQSRLSIAICKLADGSSIQEVFGKQRIDYPLIHYSFMGHITPQEVRRCMREHLVTGGCANRMLWLPVPATMEASLPELSEDTRTKIAAEIGRSLKFAASKRAVQMTASSNRIYDEFYAGIQSEQKATDDEVMKHMIARFPMHVKKVALVLAMLKRCEAIEENEMLDAISIVNMSRETVRDCFTPSLPMSVEAAIIDHLEKHSRLKENELLKELSLKKFQLAKIRKALKEMVSAGILKYRREDQGDGNFPPVYSIAD